MAPRAQARVEASVACRKEAQPAEICPALPFGMKPVDGDRAGTRMDQPAAIRSSVVLPVPFAPRMRTRSPRATESARPSKNRLFPPLLRDV